jgi:hypothetical protein
MTETQDRIRAATRAAARVVHKVPPLDLQPGTALDAPDDQGWRPTPSPGRPVPARAAGAFRARGWAAPLTAAAAVLAIALGLVAVRDLPPGRPATTASPTAAASHSASVPPRPVAASAGVPSYYVTLDDAGQAPGRAAGNDSPYSAVVADTFTGARLATVSPPAGSTFAGVTAAADDRTFVLDATPCTQPDAASQVCPRTWYLLRVAPGGDVPARLTRLPIPPTAPGTQVQAMALSPDGSQLAVALQPGGRAAGSARESLVLYSTVTGAVLRTWDGPPGTILTPGQWFRVDSFGDTLRWLADGRTLAFGNQWTLRTLDTRSRGHDLIADSRVAWITTGGVGDPPGYQLSCDEVPLAIDDGAAVVCGATGEPSPGHGPVTECSGMWDNAMGFLLYSTATRKLTSVPYLDQTTCTAEVTASVYWSSPSGGTLIALLNSAPEADPAGPMRNEVGLIAAGTFTPLPVPAGGGLPMTGASAW